MDTDIEKSSLEFLCETVRFINSIKKYENWELMQAAEVSKYKKMNGAFRRIEKKIEAFQENLGVEFLDFSGKRYEIELPIETLNVDDFESMDNLIIADMVEPVIKKKNSSEIVRFGKVILKEEKKG
ncbi:MAG: hypothetical protein PUF95_08510 [Selenomonadaceae bacterium]|nr:hypothetical protein [Selenomonadaceae bacterium]